MTTIIINYKYPMEAANVEINFAMGGGGVTVGDFN